MKNLRHLAGFLALGALLGLPALAAGDAPTPAPGRSTSVPLAPDAPSSYTVQRGDTLWAIASKFLSQPWYWPEIWYLNPDIKNPHRIYPGDTLHLVYVDGGNGQMRPEIRVERGNEVRLSPQVRELPLSEAITAIPYEIVAAFMSKPSVIASEELDKLPYVVAIGNRQVAAGMDDMLYVRGLHGGEPGLRYSVVHVGERLVDPDNNRLLGYQGIFTGRARLEQGAQGDGRDDLAKLILTESARETLPGDRTIRENLDVPVDFIPHSPSRQVHGRLISVIGGVNIIGQYQVVVVNRGKSDGLEPGAVLGIWEVGDAVTDHGPEGLTNNNQFKDPFRRTVQLPSELAGNFMVFKTYEHLSYGLVMSATSEIHVGDVVKNP
ncbi:MAG TPA: LysM peptidoglycan-binding domain-containing protein [Steroidobacteraceae bacterium]|nr:LysM peptidoglycan-binding domain-containing protein [Steroidobacteraceae bacterium]